MKSKSTPPCGGDAMLTDLMRFLPDGMTLNGWAVGAGVNRAVWGDIRRHGNPARRTLEKLLEFAGSSIAEFEALRVDLSLAVAAVDVSGVTDRRRMWRTAPRGAMPVFEADIVDPLPLGAARIPAFVLRAAPSQAIATPESLSQSPAAYAFVLPVGNMWPRYRPGRRLIVDPGRAAAIGDDVLVSVDASGPMHGRCLIVGELVWQDKDAVRLRQFTPPIEFTAMKAGAMRIDRIAGEAI